MVPNMNSFIVVDAQLIFVTELRMMYRALNKYHLSKNNFGESLGR